MSTTLKFWNGLLPWSAWMVLCLCCMVVSAAWPRGQIRELPSELSSSILGGQWWFKCEDRQECICSYPPGNPNYGHHYICGKYCEDPANDGENAVMCTEVILRQRQCVPGGWLWCNQTQANNYCGDVHIGRCENRKFKKDAVDGSKCPGTGCGLW